MAEIRTVSFPLANAGLVQKTDPALLAPGEYYRLENLITIQEGALSLRRGAERKCAIPGSLVHTIVGFRASASDQHLYVGEGEDIYRVKVGQWSPVKVAESASPWGAVWNAAPYFAGESGSPYIFIAAGNKMLKDTGSLSELENWGIEPPEEPAQAEVVPSQPIYALSGSLSLITPDPGYWETAQTTVNADLGRGGDPAKGYDSKDPVRITLYLGQANAVQEIRVLLSVGDETFVNRYEKAIVPSALASYLALQEEAAKVAEQMAYEYDRGIREPYELPEGGQAVVPEEMRPAAPTSPLSDVVEAPKDEWIKIGAAGQPGYDWRSVRAVMIQVRSAVAGITVSVGPIALYGGYGPDNSGATDAEYRWVYTYRNSRTGHESAPSPIMEAGVRSTREMVRLSLAGSWDPQVDKIAVYRAGGAFSDGNYRLVGEVSNAPGAVSFDDTASDADIMAAPLAEFDNFPPPTGWICLHAFDSLFVAGINGYPHVLAKSKTGRPESFPIINEATGASHRINVGSPSDPIMALAEFNGFVVSLNLSSIYVIGLWQGEMREAVRTPAERGLIAPKAWCKADNELWFLSHDGVYSWSGGSAIRRSTAIDWMFRGERVNGIAPLDLTQSGLRYASMAYHRNAVWLSARDVDGNYIVLVCESSDGRDRWHIFRPASEGGQGAAVTALYEDTVTATLYSGRSVGSSAYLYREDWGASDNGAAIPFRMRTGWLSFQDNQGLISDLVVELTSSAECSLAVYADYDSTPVAQFTVPATSRRGRVSLPLANQLGQPSGREVAALAVEIWGAMTAPFTLHTMAIRLAPLAGIQRGRTEDWDSLGYPYDKRLDQITIQYDAKGGSITAYLDVLSGIQGNEQQEAVAVFTLTGAGRSQASFPVLDSAGQPVVAKMVRLRYSGDRDFIVYDRNITFERYPPDVVRFTEPSDWGTPYEKYFEQLVLDVDTGNVPATVKLVVDGVTRQTLSLQTTAADRRRTLTLAPGIKGRKAWIEGVPGSGGKFQLFDYQLVAIPADKGPVIHTFDWDDLGHPHDKLLKSVSVEYEVTENAVVHVDGLKGPTGGQQVIRILDIPLRSGGRFRETFALPADTVVRMVRLYPEATNVQFRAWRYHFDRENLPADVVAQTEWDYSGWPYEKILRDIVLEVDTGGATVNVALDVDGAEAWRFSVNTTYADRVRIVAAPSDIVGKVFRLRPLGSPAKFAVYSVRYNVIPEPPSVDHWDSYELNAGVDGPKILRRMNLQYAASAPVRLRVIGEAGQTLLDQYLPVHPRRTTELIRFPSVYNGAANRVRVFRVVMDSDEPFKFYRESSWIELIPQTAGQRQSYVRVGFGAWEATRA